MPEINRNRKLKSKTWGPSPVKPSPMDLAKLSRFQSSREGPSKIARRFQRRVVPVPKEPHPGGICVVARLRSKEWIALPVFSREAAKEYSPRRKPWVAKKVGNEQAPEGRKRSYDTDSGGTPEFRRTTLRAGFHRAYGASFRTTPRTHQCASSGPQRAACTRGPQLGAGRCPLSHHFPMRGSRSII